jgi:hypothetical protein
MVHFDIFDVNMTQDIKEITSMDYPQHGEVFYFYGQDLHNNLEYHLASLKWRMLYKDFM